MNLKATASYLRDKGIQWTGEIPLVDRLHPPQFLIFGTLILGSGVKFFTDMGPSRIHVDDGATLTIGDHSVLNAGLWIRARKHIVIGHHALIGQRVTILDSNLHPKSPKDKQEPRPIRMGNNIWLCPGSVVRPGATIGDHSVIGENSVVKGDIGSRKILSGNPTHLIESIECPDDWIRVDNCSCHQK